MPSIFKMGSKSGRKTSADYNAGQSPQNPSIAESSQPTAPSHIRVSSVPIHTRQADSISQNPIPADGKLFRASTTAPVNIAVINAPQSLENARTQACLRELRKERKTLEAADPSLPPLSTYSLRIVSSNNFPTAAGLASSAAGFAALVRAIADLYELPHTAEELSRIARQGSGSACRSLFGGYAAWHRGELVDGSDSVAAVIAPTSKWPTIRALILVVSDAKKDVSSTAGMQATVATSTLFATRANDVVPQRMGQMAAAIETRDFSTFGLLTMRESNSFHATCMDTWPPIFYLTDTSRAAIRMVEAINTAEGELVAAYTFDAGPNAVIFFEEANADRILNSFRAVVGHVPGWGQDKVKPGQAVSPSQPLQVDERVAETLKGGVSRVILTSVGEGPVSVQDHLVDQRGICKSIDLA